MSEALVNRIPPVELIVEFDSPHPRAAVWDVLSDTDRFNAVAGMGYTFTEVAVPGQPAQRIGHGTWLGILPLTWEERRFRHRAPEELTITRVFDGSPAREVRVKLTLAALGEGTRVRYAVEVDPRSALTRPLCALELRYFTARRLERAIHSLASAAGDGAAIRRLLPPPDLGAAAKAHLEVALARMERPEIAAALKTWIESAPLRDQAHMHPLRLAQAWALPADDVVEGFLRGVQAGALSLQWEVICPTCRLPRMELTHLRDLQGTVHCDACDVTFDAAFPDSLSVSFRPAPTVREIPLELECVGGPGRRPHVIAEAEVFKDQLVEIPVFLEEGTYRIRSWPPLPMATLEVTPEGSFAIEELVAQDDGFTPNVQRVTPGKASLKVRSRVRPPLDLVVERRWMPSGVLTGARLLAHPAARGLLPAGFLDLDTLTEVHRLVVLAVDSRGTPPIEMIVRPFGAFAPRFLRKRFDGLIAGFATVEEALGALKEISGRGQMTAALTIGPLIEALAGPERVPLGDTLEEAQALIKTAAPGTLSIPARLEAEPELVAALTARALTPRPTTGRPFDAPAALWIPLVG